MNDRLPLSPHSFIFTCYEAKMVFVKTNQRRLDEDTLLFHFKANWNKKNFTRYFLLVCFYFSFMVWYGSSGLDALSWYENTGKAARMRQDATLTQLISVLGKSRRLINDLSQR